MGIGRLISYVGIPALVGAGAGVIAHKIGYDFSALEGMRQTVIAALPAAALFSTASRENLEEWWDWAGDHPYIAPVLAGGFLAGLYYLGGLGMKHLTQSNVSQGFVAIAGGLEGILKGMMSSVIGRLKK